MSRAAAAVLAATLAACGRPSAPLPASPEALGAEIATFPQLLVPLSTAALAELDSAAGRRGGLEHVTTADFMPSYQLAAAPVDGRVSPVMVAYTNHWLAPANTLNQPMSIAQFFRAYATEPKAAAAVVIAPKGEIVVTRAQLRDVRAKAVALSSSDADLPFTLIRGNLR